MKKEIRLSIIVSIIFCNSVFAQNSFIVQQKSSGSSIVRLPQINTVEKSTIDSTINAFVNDFQLDTINNNYQSLLQSCDQKELEFMNNPHKLMFLKSAKRSIQKKIDSQDTLSIRYRDMLIQELKKKKIINIIY